jgi:hypothetical protein
MPTLLMVVVSLALHLWLGWPLWAGVAVVGALAVGRSLASLLSYGDALRADRIRLGLEVVGGMVIAMLTAYIPMVVVMFWTKHPSW